jgi:hypothetical protein
MKSRYARLAKSWGKGEKADKNALALGVSFLGTPRARCLF